MDKRIIKKGNEYHMEPWGGDNFSECARVAVQEAKALGETVILHFNSAALKVTGSSNPAALEKEYHDELDRSYKAYQASPAGRAAEARRIAENARDQKKIDDLVKNQLDGALAKGIGATVMWLKDYALVADNMNLKTYRSDVLGKLKGAGFKNNAHVGRKDLETDYIGFGEYLVGQAINCMESGMPPHPAATEKFADQILAMETKYKVMHPVKLNGKAPPPTGPIELLPKVKLKTKNGL
jgi:hypothetical protein